MAIRDIFKISWKTFFNPLGWIDYEGLKNQNKTLYSTLKDTFTQPQPQTQETFEQAKERLGLTEADVKRTATQYRIYALLFFLLGVSIFFYGFYLLFKYVTILGWLLGVAAAAYSLSLAFKFDFWSFQMRQRKLGVTFAEWKRSFLSDKGPSS